MVDAQSPDLLRSAGVLITVQPKERKIRWVCGGLRTICTVQRACRRATLTFLGRTGRTQVSTPSYISLSRERGTGTMYLPNVHVP